MFVKFEFELYGPWSNKEYFESALSGMLVHRRVTLEPKMFRKKEKKPENPTYVYKHLPTA